MILSYTSTQKHRQVKIQEKPSINLSIYFKNLIWGRGFSDLRALMMRIA